jgi:hypothetical protein
MLLQFRTWQTAHFRDSIYKLSTGETLQSIAQFLLPPNSSPRKHVLVQTKNPEWTAYFDNATMRGDPIPTLGHLSGITNFRSIAVMSEPFAREPKPGYFGGVSFLLMGPGPAYFLNYLRHVQVIGDRNRFRFEQRGSPLSCEDINNYTLKQKQYRLTSDSLHSICAHFGLEIFDPLFYNGAAALVTDGQWTG